ncbi:MAG: ATP-binding protein [Endomicrobium sp.]|jgi:predicted AAA+ superfamily ATPase|nr:ATP-binding protein [Endomicrobium sp.]
MYYKRTLSKIINDASDTFPAVLINGPRQVGKTTIFEHTMEKNRTYVSLDDPHIRSIAKTDPALFFKTYTPPILIDEIQYVPELFPYIKMIIDKEKRNGLFWLTGSQMFHLMKNTTESLAGRVAVLNLQGLSQGEKLKHSVSVPFLPSFELKRNASILSLSEIYKLIWQGSYPRLLAEEKMNWKLFYGSYISTYVEKDVRAFVNITQEHNFLKFLKVAAARTGQLLNYSDIAKDVEISVNTAKNWISVLETFGLIYLLYPYSNNITSRAIKTPKLYFFDTGLACYLTGWDTAKVLENGAMNGAMLETYVVSEIIKSYWHNGEQARIYFYRDRDKKEIDLIIEKNNKLYPIEIKRTANPNVKDIKNFSILKSFKKEIGIGAVICLTDSPLAIAENTTAMPLTYL